MNVCFLFAIIIDLMGIKASLERPLNPWSHNDDHHDREHDYRVHGIHESESGGVAYYLKDNFLRLLFSLSDSFLSLVDFSLVDLSVTFISPKSVWSQIFSSSMDPCFVRDILVTFALNFINRMKPGCRMKLQELFGKCWSEWPQSFLIGAPSP